MLKNKKNKLQQVFIYKEEVLNFNNEEYLKNVQNTNNK
jgi:hypothetical protein